MESILPWLIFVSVVVLFLLSVKFASRLSDPNGMPKEIEKFLDRLEESFLNIGAPSPSPAVIFGHLTNFFLKCLASFGRWISRSWHKAKEIASTPLSSLTILNLFTLVFYAFVVVFVSKAILFIALLAVLALLS